VQVGITEVVYSQSYYMDAEAAEVFGKAGVKLRQFSPPREGMVDLSRGPNGELASLPVFGNGHA
jgi:dCMP deaminase